MYHSAERDQIDSPLLRLPAEMCNIIYSFAMDEAHVHLTNELDAKMRHDYKDVSLLQTCRQISDEARALRSVDICLARTGCDLLNQSAHQGFHSHVLLGCIQDDEKRISLDLIG